MKDFVLYHKQFWYSSPKVKIHQDNEISDWEHKKIRKCSMTYSLCLRAEIIRIFTTDPKKPLGF